MLAPDGGDTADTEVTPGPRDTDAQSAPRDAAKPKSQVPVRREGLTWSMLSVDYQRILQMIADRARLDQGPLACQEMAALFGMDGSCDSSLSATRSASTRHTDRTSRSMDDTRTLPW